MIVIAQTYLPVFAQPAAISIFPFYYTVLLQLRVSSVVCILAEYEARNSLPVWNLVNPLRCRILFCLKMFITFLPKTSFCFKKEQVSVFRFSFDDNGSISLSLIEARRTYWKQVASSFLKLEAREGLRGKDNNFLSFLSPFLVPGMEPAAIPFADARSIHVTRLNCRVDVR